jgi:hypothetical protein
MNSKHTWELPEAIGVVRWLDSVCKDDPIHFALGGGALLRGYSDSHLDIIVTPNNTSEDYNGPTYARQMIQDKTSDILSGWEQVNSNEDSNEDYDGDGKAIHTCNMDGRTIKFYFVY